MLAERESVDRVCTARRIADLRHVAPTDLCEGTPGVVRCQLEPLIAHDGVPCGIDGLACVTVLTGCKDVEERVAEELFEFRISPVLVTVSHQIGWR